MARPSASYVTHATCAEHMERGAARRCEPSDRAGTTTTTRLTSYRLCWPYGTQHPTARIIATCNVQQNPLSKPLRDRIPGGPGCTCRLAIAGALMARTGYALSPLGRPARNLLSGPGAHVRRVISQASDPSADAAEANRAALCLRQRPQRSLAILAGAPLAPARRSRRAGVRRRSFGAESHTGDHPL